MRPIIYVATGALVVLVIVFLTYFLIGNFALKPSSEPAEWGHFGSYFGGVAGPLLTAGSALFIAHQISLQRKQMVRADEHEEERDMRGYLDAIDSSIRHLLGRPIHSGSEVPIEFGDILNGIAPSNYAQRVSPVTLRAAVARLLRETCDYCEAIRLYRDNMGYDVSHNKSDYMLRAHVKRADEYLKFISKNPSELSGEDRVSLRVAEHFLWEDTSDDEEEQGPLA